METEVQAGNAGAGKEPRPCKDRGQPKRSSDFRGLRPIHDG